MKKSLYILAVMMAIYSASCSKDFLEVENHGVIDDQVLATEKGIDVLLIGAYSMLDGTSDDVQGEPWATTSSGWLYSEVRSLIACRGSDNGDASDMNPISNYSETQKNSYLNSKWKAIYEAISRCNHVIRVTRIAEQEGNITPEQSALFINQARGLRGWYHFEAWRLWEKIAYVDEFTGIFEANNKNDYRDKIISDLEAGTQLPDNMAQIGRFNGTVCKVLLAKALMQMYHNYIDALPLLEYVKNSGTRPNGEPVGLAPTYGEIFDIENRNDMEAVFTVQYSVNDGSGGYNGGYGEVLNFPYSPGGPAGCCGFYLPTQEFVNSFRTSGGLPLLDFSYNNDPVTSDMGISSEEPFTEDAGPLDPRLDWSVGRRGIPYWDWGEHPGEEWIRDQEYSGPYSPKKQVYKKSQEGIYTEKGSWTSGFTANGYRMIRYADVLLLLAECAIETGDLESARENINLVRARAADPEGFVKESDGVTPAANYQISQYPSFPDADYARKALYMERKLELGMEGHRWYDLNRWGIMISEINRVLEYQRTLPNGPVLYNSVTVGPEDVTYPIPLRQIELSEGNLVQNRVIQED